MGWAEGESVPHSSPLALAVRSEQEREREMEEEQMQDEMSYDVPWHEIDGVWDKLTLNVTFIINSIEMQVIKVGAWGKRGSDLDKRRQS